MVCTHDVMCGRGVQPSPLQPLTADGMQSGQDLTLPLISLFTGAGFNKIVKESFEHGAGRIEDLWLKYALRTGNVILAVSLLRLHGLMQCTAQQVLLMMLA